MAEIRMYLYSLCSSCRDALRFLRELDVDVDQRDIFTDRLTAAEIEELLSRLGVEPKDVLSTRSRPYRELELEERVLASAEIVDLMSRHPALIRRPLTVFGANSVIGFNRTGLAALAEEANKERVER